MPISGLLLTLKPSPALQAQTVEALKARSEIEVGQTLDRWLPVAVDAADDEANRQLHDWIAALPAVEFVDVVSVHFERPEDPSTSTNNTFSEVQSCR